MASSMNETEYNVLQHYGPVTALKIVNEFIIAGYGPVLKVFLLGDDGPRLVHSRQVFKRNKIHCLSVHGSRLAVAGARSFCVIDMRTFDDAPEKAINEWITTLEFLNRDTLLILNSHNTIYKLSLKTFEIEEKVHCGEKSILYSGSIRVVDDSTAYIAAGTVMSGVMIWELHTKEILCVIADHEGSIFGVQIDPTGKFIISCSDDRSIKLYDFSDRRTPGLLATGWGHGSRIWNLAFFNDCSIENLKIASFGEDCTIRIWGYNGSNQLLQQKLLENVHAGKHIWSGDLESQMLKLFVSGGADGKIRLHDLDPENESLQSYTLSQISKELALTFAKKEIVRQFVEVGDLLVLLTSRGTLFTMDQSTKKFTFLHTENKLVDFGIMKALGDSVIIAARNGDLLIIKFVSGHHTFEWIKDEILLNNKVTNFLTAKTSNGNFYTLTDSPNPSIPFVLRVFDENIKLLSTTKLQQPDQTSFTTTDMVIDEENNWLVLSSRYVSVIVYDLKDGHSGLFKKLSSGDTITSVSILKSVKGKLTVLITVRDGVYMYAEISERDSIFSIQIILENKLSRGFVEGGFVQNTDLILFGFKSSYFYVWNETKQVELTNQLCGGIHRQWQLFRGNDFHKFAYINKSELFIKYTKERFENYGVLNEGTHGREIRDVSLGPETANGRLLVSASEDSTLKLYTLEAAGTIKTFWTLNNHVSGLQRVKFLDSNFVASCAANEEFYIWQISYLDAVPVMKEFARLKPANTVNPDLRIMDFATFKSDSGFIIATVYSDSNIKIWNFDLQSKRFSLLAHDFYKTCCILNVDFLVIGEQKILQIGSTDGYLTLWDVSKLTQSKETTSKLGAMVINQQLHQNGIKAILPMQTSSGYKILTGGDDNALILSELTARDGLLYLETKSFIQDAASSTITSISRGAGETFVVTSVDQIIRKWTFAKDKLICLAARYTTIADTGCSDSVVTGDETTVVIGGAGLSVWSC